MAVAEFYEARDAAKVTYHRGGTKSYSAPWKCRVTSARDDGDTIATYLAGRGMGIDSAFRYGDRVDLGSFCDSIAPVRAESLFWWDVTLTYSPPDKPAQGTGTDGNPTGDPLSWAYEIDSTTDSFETPVWKAWNIDAFPLGGSGGGYARSANVLGPVVNSAGTVLDPPLMRTQTETVYRFTGYLPEFRHTRLTWYRNRINASALRWHDDLLKWYGFEDELFLPYEVLCSGAAAALRRYNQIPYWAYTYELRIRERWAGVNPQDGWLETILDRGLNRAADVGDPDGLGGQYASGDLKAGMARAAACRGPDGGRVPELVLLDGHGQPLLSGEDAVYFRWRIHEEGELRLLPLHIFKAA